MVLHDNKKKKKKEKTATKNTIKNSFTFPKDLGNLYNLYQDI